LKKDTGLGHIVHKFDNLYDGVKKEAERYGDRVRYYYRENKEDKIFTYNDMKLHVDYIAAALTKLGLDGKFNCVTGDTHPNYVASYIATASTNGVIIPLDKEISDEQFVNFMLFCDTEVVFYTASQQKKINACAQNLPLVKLFVCISQEAVAFPEGDERFKTFEEFFEIGRVAYEEEGIHAAEENVPDMEKMCAIIFTSGTTGSSKGVMLSQKNLVTATMDSNAIIDCSEEDTFVSVLPIHHTYEFTCGQLALPNAGAATMINDSIKNTMRNFAKFKPTALILVPLYVETMYKKVWSEIDKKGKRKTVRAVMKMSDALLKVGVDIRRKLFKDIHDAFGGRLKYIVCGGAPLRPELVKDFDSFGINIYEGYGITECSPLISCNPMGWKKYHSAGLKVNSVEVRIDKTNPDDETGEIVVKGDNVMLGYYKNPKATVEVFTKDGWFRTGDIGYKDKDEFIFITGRKKNVIILSNGKNVFPEELEEYITKSDLVAECVVVGRKDEKGEETSIAAIIYPDYAKFEGKTPEEIKAALEELIANTNKKLPSFKHVNTVEVRETEFEKNTSRKILRYKVK
jgi:long-chain acyl-CoA synthetase